MDGSSRVHSSLETPGGLLGVIRGLTWSRPRWCVIKTKCRTCDTHELCVCRRLKEECRRSKRNGESFWAPLNLQREPYPRQSPRLRGMASCQNDKLWDGPRDAYVMMGLIHQWRASPRLHTSK